MLNLNYYFVDVDENSCLVAQMELDVNLRELLLSKDKSKIILVREYMTRALRKKLPFVEEEEFKVVCVNKQDKLSVDAQVADSATRKSVVDPTVSNENYDIFFINPGQELHVSCQVLPRETEIRNIEYHQIETNCSKRYMKFR